MQTMARGLAEAGVTDVAVPRVYEALTTRRVLVSEWIDGKKLSECSTEEVRELVAIGQECFLVQLLQTGPTPSPPPPAPGRARLGSLAERLL